MNHSERIEFLKQTINIFSSIIGPDTEIVLHDLKKREMVYIVNGSITGRSVGYKMSDAGYDAVLDSLVDDSLVGYATRSYDNKKIKASHFLIRNDDAAPCALICVNQDITRMEQVCTFLASTISCAPFTPTQEPQILEDDTANFILTITHNTIMQEVEKMKPLSIENKESRISILTNLEAKGVFLVKDSVPVVCRTLNISQATLYNYLREIRNG